MLHASDVRAYAFFLVKLIPIVRNLTWIADNRYPSEDGWLGWIRVWMFTDESMVLYPVDDGSVLGDLVTCWYHMH